MSNLPTGRALTGLSLTAILLAAAACSTGSGGVSFAVPSQVASTDQPAETPNQTGVPSTDPGGGAGPAIGSDCCVTQTENGPGDGGDPTVPPDVQRIGPLTRTTDTVSDLLTVGNADLTNGLVAQLNDNLLHPASGALDGAIVPVKVAVSNTPLLGSVDGTGQRALGASALLTAPVTGALGGVAAAVPIAVNANGQSLVGSAVGSVANVGLLNGSGAIAANPTQAVSAVASAVSSNNVLNVNLGGAQVLGNSNGPAVISVGGGSTAAPASVASVTVPTGATGAGPLGGLTSTVGKVTGGILGL